MSMSYYREQKSNESPLAKLEFPCVELQVLQREAGTAHHCQRGSCNDQQPHAATHNNNNNENQSFNVTHVCV